MVTVRGRSEVARYIGSIPGQMDKVLRGAGRAAANVVAGEARQRSISSEVTAAIKVKVTASDGRIVARVQVKGKGAYIAPWLEYGTSPHFISVDDSQRNGMSVQRINRLDKAAHKDGRAGPGDSLVINGKFVGTTVHHPGAKKHPFLRPALDMKEAEALAAAQRYINRRIAGGRIVATETEADEG